MNPLHSLPILAALTTLALAAPPATAPATQPSPIQLTITLSTDQKTAQYAVNGKSQSDPTQLTQSLRDLARTTGKDVSIDLQFPPDLPYEHLAKALVSMAQANIRSFRLTTDGKEFSDFQTPRINSKGPKDDPPFIPGVGQRRIVKLTTTDGKLTATIDSNPLKSPEELITVLKEYEAKEKLQIIISPDAHTKSSDVLTYAKAALTPKTQVAFSPAR